MQPPEGPVPHPCHPGAEAQVLLGPEDLLREGGQPEAVLLPFEAPENGTICIQVRNGGLEGTGPVSSATISMDGTVIIGEEAFNQNVELIQESADVEAGPHQLEALLRSSPGSGLTVTVFFAGDHPTSWGEAQGVWDKIRVSLLFDEPDSFVPSSTDPGLSRTTLSALVAARETDGLQGRCEWFKAGYVFFLLDPQTCEPIRTLQGEASLCGGPASEGWVKVRVEDVWDGRDEAGELMMPGTYLYRVQVSLLRQRGGHLKIIDRVQSPLGEVTIGQGGPQPFASWEELEEALLGMGSVCDDLTVLTMDATGAPKHVSFEGPDEDLCPLTIPGCDAGLPLDERGECLLQALSRLLGLDGLSLQDDLAPPLHIPRPEALPRWIRYRQRWGGLPVRGAVAAVLFNADGEPVALESSLLPRSLLDCLPDPDTAPLASPETYAEFLSLEVNRRELEVVNSPGGDCATLAWSLYTNDDQYTVDAQSCEILSILPIRAEAADLVIDSHANYLGWEDMSWGECRVVSLSEGRTPKILPRLEVINRNCRMCLEPYDLCTDDLFDGHSLVSNANGHGWGPLRSSQIWHGQTKISKEARKPGKALSTSSSRAITPFFLGSWVP